ncbi:MAG: MFS transporter [Eubacteriales bacterium]|nr:MFS transporter [Eubacteriales bacterium]
MRRQAVDARYSALYVYFFLYFIVNGLTTFLPKYYGEVGMTDSQIGMLTSIPCLLAVSFMPLMGALSDRVSKKRYLLALWLLMMAGISFVTVGRGSFWALLVAMSLYVTFGVAVSPIANTISLEYCQSSGRPFGPIRLMGTVGYQAGVMLIAIVLTHSLRNLYLVMGIVLLASCAATFFMPNVEGHQHNAAKVPVRAIFADRHVCWLLGLILFATVSTQFYESFFTKHLGDLGMSNTSASWITMLTVLPEIPFLFFGDRIIRRTNVWNWLLIGILLNGVRWLGLAVCTTPLSILCFQAVGVSVMACFEFVPAFYLARRVAAEQSGTAQSLLGLTTFGVAKIIGGLLGGLICEHTGIPAVFAFNGAALLMGGVIFWKPTRRLIREEESAQVGV